MNKVIPVEIEQFINMMHNDTSGCDQSQERDSHVVYSMPLSSFNNYYSSFSEFNDFARKLSLLKQYDWMLLSDYLPVAHLHEYETKYLFKEIFIDNTYFKHGIKLPENACIIDIGANIGLFSLYSKLHYPDSTIYAFEPIKSTYDILHANFALHEIGQAFNYAITDIDGHQEFTHYKNSTVFSGKYAQSTVDGPKIKSIVKDMIKSTFTQLSEGDLDSYTDLLTKDRMDSIKETVKTLTLKSFVEQYNISRIDLLKVDAEGCEFELMWSIDEKGWDIINQIVVEVHPKSVDDVPSLIKLFRHHDFDVVSDQEAFLSGTGLFNLYAKKKNHVCSGRAVVPTADPFNELEIAILQYIQQSTRSLRVSLVGNDHVHVSFSNLYPEADNP